VSFNEIPVPRSDRPRRLRSLRAPPTGCEAKSTTFSAAISDSRIPDFEGRWSTHFSIKWKYLAKAC